MGWARGRQEVQVPPRRWRGRGGSARAPAGSDVQAGNAARCRFQLAGPARAGELGGPGVKPGDGGGHPGGRAERLVTRVSFAS
jgi:hypothetical protein